MRPGRANLRPRRANMKPGRANLKLNRGGMDGQTDGWTDVSKFPPVFYRTSALWGCCPKSQQGQMIGLRGKI